MARLPDELADLARAPRHVGPPARGHDRSGRSVNPACGDVLVLYLALEGNTISAAGFKAQGCPASLAMASAACEILPGMAADDSLCSAFRVGFTAAHGSPAPAHRHALSLVEAALRDAVRR